MYLTTKGRLSKHIDFIILDLLCMEISFILSYYIRHHDFSLFDNKIYRTALIILIVINILICYIFYTMQDVIKRNKQLEFYSTTKQVFLTTVIFIIYLFATKTSEDISRNVVITFPILYLTSSFFLRLIFKSFVKKLLKYKQNRQFLIITVKNKVDEILNNINNTINDITIKGIVILDDNSISDINGYRIVANKNDLFKYLQTEYIDEILISVDSYNAGDIIKKLTLTGIVLHIVYNGMDDLVGSNNKLIVENLIGTTVVTSTINTINPLQLIVKRFIDIIFGIIGTILTIFLFIIIGPIIKVKSKGPIIFTQKRVGKNGKIFNILKFRSMYIDAEERKKDLLLQNETNNQMMFKMDNDPRVVKGIGEFIRKTSIDEFPQFINVLKGDMSIVGTRPPTLDEWNKYELHHRARLAIKPGITGLWQVSGRSNIKDFEEVVRLDTEYIKNFSLWKDAAIIYKTIKVVLNREGAE